MNRRLGPPLRRRLSVAGGAPRRWERKTAVLASIAFAAALAQADCEALKAGARAAIEHANGDFVRALKARDAGAIAAAYADDGMFVLPDGRVVAGRSAVRDL